MKKIAYNQTLGEVFQVVQGKYKSDDLINAPLFEKILATFSERSHCMQNATLEELQSETCVNAFQNNNDAIFNDMLALLEKNPNLSDQLERWKPLAKLRVNPRPIGRGYKREPRSGSILV